MTRMLDEVERIGTHEVRGWSERVPVFAPRARDLGAAPAAAAAAAPNGGVSAGERRQSPGRRLTDRLREETLAIASHELNTPLAILQTSLDLLDEELECGQPLPAAVVGARLAPVRRQVERLRALVRLICESTRLEAGSEALTRVAVDLRSLAEEAIEEWQRSTHRHQLRLLAASALPVVGRWDRHRLALVLQNLIGNAIKYSPDGGEIVVSVTGAEQAVVCVRDRGSGIDEEHLARVFDRGYRVPTAGPGGSGLGLYIARRIVEAHGGRLWAESAGQGQGSTFCFTLPYDRSG